MTFYDRREWSRATILGYIATGFLLLFLRLSQLTPLTWRGPLTLLTAVAFLFAADFSGLRIVLTLDGFEAHSGLSLKRHFIPYGRMIGVERAPLRVRPLPRGWRDPRYFTAYLTPRSQPRFKITLNNGDICVVQSKYTEEILKIIKEVCPTLVVKSI